MSMSALVRALGAAAGGFSTGLDKAEAAADRQRKRDQDAEDRAFTMAERARATKLRTDIGAASAPVEVSQVEQAGPVDTGSDIEAARQPLAAIPKVQGKSYESPQAATMAAAAANAPQAVAQRQAQVLSQAGNPLGAQQLRTGAMQEQSAKYTLNAAERADLDARFNDDVEKRITDWPSFGQFISDSVADGMGGKLKGRFVPSPDGKTSVFNVAMPDGTLRPTEKAFPNTAAGFALAKEQLKRITPEKKLAHLHQMATLAQTSERDAAKAGHDAGMLEVAKNKAAAEIELARMKAKAEWAKAGGGQPVGLTLDDLKDGHRRIAATLNDDWKTEIAQPTDPAALKASKVARETEIDTVQRLYTGAMSAGFSLTPEQAIAAFRNGKPGTGTFRTRDGGTVKVDGVMYGGRFIPMADSPGVAPRAKPAAEAPAATSPRPASAPAAVGLGAPAQASMQARASAAAADPPEAMALDRARAVARDAHAKMMTYGSSQRAKDPQGFAAAQQAYIAAKAAMDGATRAYTAALSRDPNGGRMVRMAQP